MYRPHKFDPPWIDFFTRPCPWFAKQLTSFPQFPRLPKELQLMIWDRAIPCRQVVSLSRPLDARPDLGVQVPPSELAFETKLQYRRPGMLQACFDARTAGLKHFMPAFGLCLPAPIRFNFDRDYLELDMYMLEWIATIHEQKAVALVEPPMVKNLAVSHYRPFRAEDIVFICKYFSGLEMLMLNEPEIDDSMPTSGFIHVFKPQEAGFIARHRWKELRRPIMKRIRGVRPRLDKWQPPTLFVGTDTQWARHALEFVKMEVLPKHKSMSKSSFMDWQPTVNIPSLHYVDRLETVSREMPALSIQINSNTRSVYERDVAEPYKMIPWVFEDTALRFRVMNSNTGEDYWNCFWPGRWCAEQALRIM
ncbi:hypothetical protein BKA65DRAFT_534883 [Rhexocercosporidium sp. MPI-PUGE-AT-0058]|nr:hypothetical protein BKA65DRAFT_534883 [Rhexocercosporidium sp. MPI-PUGE-AT-0058]